jgi:hypothetical protein
VLGAGAGALLLARGPVATGPIADAEPTARDAFAEVSRSDLDRSITELSAWIARDSSGTSTPVEANLRLLALGRAALTPADLSAELRGAPQSAIRANLEALAGTATAQPAALPEGGERGTEREGDPLATLAILLEAGMPVGQQLPLGSGTVSLGRLLELALPSLSTRRDSIDPWSLDLLSFAVLAGATSRREELARRAQASLRRLDHEQRAAAGEKPTLLPEPHAPSAGTLDSELQLSSAMFRAVAVLSDTGLESQALRHLNALLRRYPDDRDSYRQRLVLASSSSERNDIHLEAVEALGRFEQALFGAHVAMRRQDRPGPPPRAALTIRRAAHDLIEHLDALRDNGLFERTAARDAAAIHRLRALAHGLRGLRAARVAT